MSYPAFQRILIELVVLATLVGLVPELTVGALKDAFGPCGFDSRVCEALYIQGCIQAIAAFWCTLGAILVAFMLSDEYLSGGEV